MANDPVWSWRKRRSHLSLMADILEIAKKDVFKTRIMYEAGLSFPQLKDYMAFLLDQNLLEASARSENTVYRTTQKGLRYLQCYGRIVELLKAETGSGPRDVNSLHLTRCGPRVIVVAHG